ncbi:MAG: hypothetical protein EA417_19425 [Gammaproteobacteria bacterium]|nr:MAG: hypothetical protein EA417_19425 [Gammaproteobacteria bacterium]
MRSLTLAIVVLTALILGARWMLQPDAVSAASVAAPEAAAADVDIAPWIEPPTSFDEPVSRVAEVSSSKPVQPFDAAGEWRDDARLPVRAPDLAQVRDFPFSASGLQSVAVGDAVQVDFPPLGGRYEMAVDEVIETGAERTIRGHIAYDDRTFPSLITVSAGWSFGSFTTPEGNYEFTARDGMARMVSDVELERRARAPVHTLRPHRT